VEGIERPQTKQLLSHAADEHVLDRAAAGRVEAFQPEPDAGLGRARRVGFLHLATADRAIDLELGGYDGLSVNAEPYWRFLLCRTGSEQ
jgi:hypothetical protein